MAQDYKRKGSERGSQELLKVRKERVRLLWALVKSSFIKKGPNILDLLSTTTTAVQTYNVVLKQGLQYRYRFQTKHPIYCIHLYSKRRDALSEAAKSAEPHSDENHVEKVVEKDAERFRVTPTAIVCVDSSRVARVWDLSGRIRSKPSLVASLPFDATQIVYLPKVSWYATCSNDKEIRFYNLNFELAHTLKVSYIVQNITADILRNELLTIGTHQITAWKLNSYAIGTRVHVEMVARYQKDTGLPENQWITDAYADDDFARLHVISNTKVMVYDMATGNSLALYGNISHRRITCACYYKKYGYTIVGCVNGTIKVINMANIVIHEFLGHIKSITALIILHERGILLSCSLDYTIRMFNLQTFKEIHCFELKDQPIIMKLIDEQRLMTWSTEGLTLFSVNHVNSPFSTLNGKFTSLLYASEETYPERIVARSEDGVIRVISPVSGKAISMSLPLLELDKTIEFVYSSCIDNTIRVSVIDPTQLHVVSTKIVIDLYYVPRLISMIDSCICVTTEDSVIHMYSINMTRNDWKLYPDHNRTEDHNDLITSMFAIPKLGLFITCGRDKAIKVWDVYNTLIREIQFHEPLHTASLANAKGDLLIGIQNRMDIIKCPNYLPQGYIQASEALQISETQLETPLLFDEKFDFRKTYIVESHAQTQNQDDAFNAEIKWFDLLHTMNFAPNRSCRPNSQENDGERVQKKFFNGSSDLLSKLDKLKNNRMKRYREAKKKVSVPDDDETEKQDVAGTEDLGKTKVVSIESEEPTSVSPVPDTEPLPAAIEPVASLLAIEKKHPSGAGVAAGVGKSRHVSAVRRPTMTRPQIYNMTHRKTYDIRGDGIMPNSVLSVKIKSEVGFVEGARAKGKPPKPENPVPVVEQPAPKLEPVQPVQPAESFTDKLKKMIEKNNERAGMKEAQESPPSDDPQQRQEVKFLQNKKPVPKFLEDGDDEPEVPAIPSYAKPLPPPPEPKYPPIIDRGLEYNWFPLEKVLVMSKDDVPVYGLRLKVEPNGDALLPLLIELFQSTKSTLSRMEIVEYITWIFEEYGFQDITSISRVFFQFLQSTTPELDNENELKLRCTVIRCLIILGCEEYEILPTLLIQLLNPSKQLRQETIEALELIGVENPRSPFLVDKLSKLLTKAKAAASASIIEEAAPKRSSSVIEPPTITTTISPSPSSAIPENDNPIQITVAESTSMTNVHEAPTNGDTSSLYVSGNLKTHHRRSKSALSVFQSVETVEFRFTIMGWLRFYLRKYLIYKSDTEETRTALTNVNTSGFKDLSNNLRDDDGEGDVFLMLDEFNGVPKNVAVLVAQSTRRASVDTITTKPARRASLPANHLAKNNGLKVKDLNARRGSKIDAITKPPLNRRKSVAPEGKGKLAGVIEYPDLPKEKDPVLTLQCPTLKDFVTVLNLLISYYERKSEIEERQRIARLLEEQRRIEQARLDELRRQAAIERIRREEDDRRLMLEQMREREEQLRREQEERAKLPKIKKPPKTETHYRLPAIGWNGKGYATGMVLHMHKLGKGLPMDKIELNPFEERGKLVKKGSKASLTSIKSKEATSEFATEKTSLPQFKPMKKFFIYDL
ncbi:WD repeat-containing protein 87 [Chytridiales sp. JEL 0842]|nr:WD repeat-containing protein 87 [Chytridiales sp. JEL 0842]